MVAEAEFSTRPLTGAALRLSAAAPAVRARDRAGPASPRLPSPWPTPARRTGRRSAPPSDRAEPRGTMRRAGCSAEAPRHRACARADSSSGQRLPPGRALCCVLDLPRRPSSRAGSRSRWSRIVAPSGSVASFVSSGAGSRPAGSCTGASSPSSEGRIGQRRASRPRASSGSVSAPPFASSVTSPPSARLGTSRLSAVRGRATTCRFSGFRRPVGIRGARSRTGPSAAGQA